MTTDELGIRKKMTGLYGLCTSTHDSTPSQFILQLCLHHSYALVLRYLRVRYSTHRLAEKVVLAWYYAVLVLGSLAGQQDFIKRHARARPHSK